MLLNFNTSEIQQAINVLLYKDETLLDDPERLSFSLCMAEIFNQVEYKNEVMIPGCESKNCLLVHPYALNLLINPKRKLLIKEKYNEFKEDYSFHLQNLDETQEDALNSGYLFAKDTTAEEYQFSSKDPEVSFKFDDKGKFHPENNEVFEKILQLQLDTIIKRLVIRENLVKVTINGVEFTIHDKLSLTTELYNDMIAFSRDITNKEFKDQDELPTKVDVYWFEGLQKAEIVVS